MFNWIQVWALAGPLKDMHRLSLKPLLCSLGCVLWVVVMLEGKPFPQFEVQSSFSSRISVYLAAFIFPSIRTSRLVPAAEKHDVATAMLHCREGISQVMSGAWFHTDLTLGLHAKKFNFGFIRPENRDSHGLRVL